MKKPIPVIGLVGYSGSGKTTFLEKLIAELKSRGYRVGVIKHTTHAVEIDQPGKDSWRHARAGAEVVALVTPGGVFIAKKYDSDPGPEEVIAMFKGVDLIIIEGYKTGKWPKIEVFHHKVSERPSIPAEDLLAVVTDAHHDAETPAVLPRFGLDDAAGVASLIERVVLNINANK